MTRKEAMSLGLKHYSTRKPCVKGHISKRLVSNFNCVECINTKRRSDLGQRRRRKYYNQNAEHLRAMARVQKKKWNEANKLRQRQHYYDRRARKAGASGRFSSDDVKALFSTQDGLCAAPHCQVSLGASYHVDHKNPLSRGGSNWPRNLQLLCGSCNDSKGTKTMREWKRFLERRL